jgi:hypothetical protein
MSIKNLNALIQIKEILKGCHFMQHPHMRSAHIFERKKLVMKDYIV